MRAHTQPSIVQLCDAAARTVAERLTRLSLSAAEHAALRRKQQVAMLADTRPIDEIRAADNTTAACFHLGRPF